MESDEYLTSMEAKMEIQNLMGQLRRSPMKKLGKRLNTYLLVGLVGISTIGLGYMLYKEVEYSRAAAACPTELKSLISGVVEIDANVYAGDNVIDCSTEDIVIQDGGILRILPREVENADENDDFGVTIQANSFTIDSGGQLDLEGQGYTEGEPILSDNRGGGRTSEGNCSGGDFCGGSGGGHGGAGGRGDPGLSCEASTPGSAYGLRESPLTLGAGGGRSSEGALGGVGGGAIKLEVTNTFTNNGEINANGLVGEVGTNSGGGGGAGGSIWVEAGGFAGSGTATANGGDGGAPGGSEKHGGGGGGGRVVLRCTDSNTETLVVSVDEGEGDVNDGQEGSLIGPSCYPPDPTSLEQYEVLDMDPYADNLIGDAGWTKGTLMNMKFDVTDIENPSVLIPQVELREVGQPFSGIVTHTGSSVTYNGAPVQASVLLSALVKTKEYKWRVRVLDQHGVYSNWVEYEEDAQEEIDLIVLGNPSNLIKISGDNQTGTVGQELTNPLVVEVQDSVGHVIPDITLSWSIKSGEGGVSDDSGGAKTINISTITDTVGQTDVYWSVGTVSGTDNNTVDVVRSGLIGSPMRFTASANPDVLHHFKLVAPSVVLTGSTFTTEITAQDQYDNIVDFDGSVNLLAYQTDEATPAGGTFSPSNTTLVDGYKEETNSSHNLQEVIKIRADDGGSLVGFSNPINVVDAFGDCFGVPNTPGTLVLTSEVDHPGPWIFNATPSNGGVINCDQKDLVVADGAVVELGSYENTGVECNDPMDPGCNDTIGVTLLAKSILVSPTGEISADGKGYDGARGPGAGTSGCCGRGSGGGHGGYGGTGRSGDLGGVPNGNVYEPTNLGSGWGETSGGEGGGAMKFIVSTTFENNGSITSSGFRGTTGDGRGSGAGGSIWIVADHFDGTGILDTDGELASNGGGSGGRISIYYETESYGSGLANEIGERKIHSYGDPAGGAGAGTVYIEQVNWGDTPNYDADLYVDNSANNAKTAGLVEGNYQFNKVELKRYGHLDVMGDGSILTVTSGSALFGDSTMPDLTIEGTFNYTGGGLLTVNGVDVGIRGEITGVTDLAIGTGGGLIPGGFTLYPYTWARSGFYAFGDVTIGPDGLFTNEGYDNGNECNDPSDTGCNDDYGIALELDNLTIDPGGVLSADGNGYGGARGPGAGKAGCCGRGSGGGHGGYGGTGRSGDLGGVPNGNVYEPISLGSGWGETSGGEGGGAIKVMVSGILDNNGFITSSGYRGTTGDGRGSGSGGSLWFRVNHFDGEGVIDVDGELATNGGGSGGRIAIYYDTEDYGAGLAGEIGDGLIHAYGDPPGGGGPGTVYVEQVSWGATPTYAGDLYVDNNSTNGFPAGLVEGSYQFNKIEMKRYGHLDVMEAGSVLTVTSGSGMIGDSTMSDLTLEGTFIYTGATLLTINGIDVGIEGEIDMVNNNNIDLGTAGSSIPGGLTLNAYTWIHNQEYQYSFDDVVVGDFGTLTLTSYDNDNECNDVNDVGCYDDYGVVINLDNLTVQSGGFVTADGLGYIAQKGPGAGTYIECCGRGDGGGYGGYGGTYSEGGGGIPYGNVYEPIDLGSGWGGPYDGNYIGAGGGALKLVVSETLTHDGLISANGVTGPYEYSTIKGSGAGGSIFIKTNDLLGSGEIEADGGPSHIRGGSGGRIAVYYETESFGTGIDMEATGGNIHAYGGGLNEDASVGGAGTVYIEQIPFGFEGDHDGDLYVDNENHNNRSAGLVRLCSNREYQNETACTSSGGTWNDINQFNQITTTRYGHLDIIGEGTGCSDIQYGSKQDCENGGETWDGGIEVIVTGGSGLIGDSTMPDITIFGTINSPAIMGINGVDLGIRGDWQGGSNISVGDQGASKPGGVTLYAYTWAHDRDNQYMFGDFNIGSDGTLTLESQEDTSLECNDASDIGCYDDYGVSLELSNFNVDVGGLVTADGKGYSGATGPGTGVAGCCGRGSGGGHGGYGGTGRDGNLGGVPNGNVYEPENIGSGWGETCNGEGGGAMKFNVSGTFNNEGTISSSGNVGTCGDGRGSGAGGSIWIIAGHFDGEGTIDVDGESLGTNGGGSGGRLAIYYETEDYGSGLENEIGDGVIHAYGNPAGEAGAGTVYTEQITFGQPAGYDGKLYVDNDDTQGRTAGVVRTCSIPQYQDEEDCTLNGGSWLDTFQFEEITLTRFGHLDFIGEGTGCTDQQYDNEGDCIANAGTWDGGIEVVITGGGALVGNDTMPDLTVFGTLNLPTTISINGVDVGVRGDLQGGANAELGVIGASDPGGMTLYAHTWAHNENYPFTFGDLTVGNYGLLTLESHDDGNECDDPDDSGCNDDYGVTIEADNLTIDASSCTNPTYTDKESCQDNGEIWGGLITADGSGYDVGRGPGVHPPVGGWSGGGGGTHGGYGGRCEEYDGCQTNGDLYQPTSLGSGGSICTSRWGNSWGGGAIKINVTDVLTIDGEISSDGILEAGASGPGGGAGGSIWIDTNTIEGDGKIYSNGDVGASLGAGGGSGGRIAIYYTTNNGFTFDHDHIYTLGGQFGAGIMEYGGPGTVYVEDKTNHTSGYGDLFITNHGNVGRGMDFFAQTYTFNNVSIGSGARVEQKSDTTTLPEGVTYPVEPSGNEHITPDVDTIAFWNMEETVDDSCGGGEDVCDSSGNDYHGTNVGDPQIITGYNGNARQFNGSTDAVTFSIPQPTLPVTIEMWIKPNTDTPIGIYDSAPGTQNVLRNSPAGYVEWWDQAPQIALDVTAGQWQHIIVTYKHDGANRIIDYYKNNELIGSVQSATGDTFGWVTFTLGNINGGAGGWYNGALDEVAIFEKELSEAERGAHYRGVSVAEYQQYLDDYYAAYPQREGSGVIYELTGNFTLEAGGIIDGSGQGFPTDDGKGKGGVDVGDNAGGGEAGHGGAGGGGHPGDIIENPGENPGDVTPGGETYGSTILPISIGSGGGTSDSAGDGGSGGSAVKIVSEGTVTVDGLIDVSGSDGILNGVGSGGGGAGGSVYIEACDVYIRGICSDPGHDNKIDCEGAFEVWTPAVLDATGGDAPVAAYRGGGGGGGIIVLAHTCADTILVEGTPDVTEGAGYGSGGAGVYGTYGIPQVNLQDQYDDLSQIPVGGTIDNKTVEFRFNVADPDAVDTLTPEVEVLRSGEGASFDETNVFQGSTIAWGGGAAVDLEVNVVGASVEVNMEDILGITSGDIDYGNVYKWRGRVIDGTGTASAWAEYGANADGTDFAITGVTCGNAIIDAGEDCDGANLGGATCISRGYDYGALACNVACGFDESGCGNWVCGNNILEPANGEQCDGSDLGASTCVTFGFDGGTIGCTGGCLYDTGGCQLCGNGTREGTEECDDGNGASGDGCTPGCIREFCGDGTVQTGIGEVCDDGNTNNGDGCSNICQVEVGGSFCGDGTIDAGETCDDGNQVNGDGCSNICQIEAAGQECGNGTTEGSEECDDGNLISGDGCSLVCLWEAGGEEEVEEECGNGILEAGEQCDGGIGDNRCSDFFGYTGGILRCNDDCELDIDGCRLEGERVGLDELPITGALRTLLVILLGLLSLALMTISIVLAFPSILIREEKKPWGLVFDKNNRKPIAFAIVRVYEGEKVTQEKTTDIQGRYGFAMGEGEYTLEVVHEAYMDFKEEVKIKAELEGKVNRDIGMESKVKEKKTIKAWWAEQKGKAKETFPKFSRYCYVFGFLFSIGATILSPIGYNFVVIGFYVILGIVYLLQGLKRGWGRVYEEADKKKGIGYAFVRLFDSLENKMVNVEMSDEKGRYMFTVEKEGIYNLVASKSGYKYPSEKEKGKIVEAPYGKMKEVTLKKGEKVIGEDLSMGTTGVGEVVKGGLGEEKFGSPFGKK